jgi:hypothetical protein
MIFYDRKVVPFSMNEQPGKYRWLLDHALDAGCHEDRHLRVIYREDEKLVLVLFWIDQDSRMAERYECKSVSEVVDHTKNICKRYFSYIKPNQITRWAEEDVEPVLNSH